MDVESPLDKFKIEVLDYGAEACLPANLSDDWLDYLEEELSCMDDASEASAQNKKPSCALAAVAQILLAKKGGKILKIPADKLIEIMDEYRIELGMETVTRRTEVKFTAATIKNIFANRKVTSWKV